MFQECFIRLKAVRALACAALVAVGLASFSAPAAAAAISGSTGLIDVPTADVLANGELELTVRYIDETLGVSAVYGVLDDVEVGVNNIRPGDGDRIGVVFKGTLYHETEDRPAVAVGLETGQSYATVSKRVTPGVRIHAGYGIGRIKGVFAGVSYSLSTVSSGGVASPVTTLMGEYTPLGLNVGARMVFSPVFSADVALIDLKEATAGLNVRLRF